MYVYYQQVYANNQQLIAACCNQQLYAYNQQLDSYNQQDRLANKRFRIHEFLISDNPENDVPRGEGLIQMPS